MRYYNNSALNFSFLTKVYKFNLNLTCAFLWETQQFIKLPKKQEAIYYLGS